eukprot:scaffold123290_cov32-Tisochrysis_lutea.AAC.1
MIRYSTPGYTPSGSGGSPTAGGRGTSTSPRRSGRRQLAGAAACASTAASAAPRRHSETRHMRIVSSTSISSTPA